MSDGTPIVGTVLAGNPTPIAGQCTGPLAGTEIEAQDVNFPLISVENDIVGFRDGNPAPGGCWNFVRTTASPPASNTPAVTCLGISTTGAVVSGQGMTALTATGGSTTGSNAAGAGAVIQGGNATVSGFGNFGAQCTAGANSNSFGCRGVGNGAGNGIEGQGGVNGNGGLFTGGASSGHGLAAISQDNSSSAIKATASAASSIAVWADVGGYRCDTITPGSSPPANTMFADKMVAAKATVSVTGGAISGSHVNCSVSINGTDATILEVIFDTDMANTNYAVSYGEWEYSTPGAIMKALTLSKATTGFALRLRSSVTGTINFSTDPGTVSLDVTVVGSQ